MHGPVACALLVTMFLAGCSSAPHSTEIVIGQDFPNSAVPVEMRTSDGAGVRWSLDGRGFDEISKEARMTVPPGRHVIAIWQGDVELDSVELNVNFGPVFASYQYDIPWLSPIKLRVNDWREVTEASGTKLALNDQELDFEALWQNATPDALQARYGFGERTIELPGLVPGVQELVFSTIHSNQTFTRKVSVRVSDHQEIDISNNFAAAFVRVLIFVPGESRSADGCGLYVPGPGSATCKLDVQPNATWATITAERYWNRADAGHDDPLDEDTLSIPYPPSRPVKVFMSSTGNIDVYQ